MNAPQYETQLDTIRSGYDGVTCWVQARAGAIPGDPPVIVVTMQQLLLSGSDVYYGINDMRSDDFGRTWVGPTPHDGLMRRTLPSGAEVVICDGTPKWHKRSGRLLLTGHTAQYTGNALTPGVRPRSPAYTVYDHVARTWLPWEEMSMPDRAEFFNSGSGCTQRYDLPNGEILLPVYLHCKPRIYASTVLRCSFDGRTLAYLEHGDELSIDVPRGFGEPSLTRFDGRFFLTLRNDEAGYVTSGEDGLHFMAPRRWTFDDGADLGNYNTQQHWVTHSEGLFLVYTRRGANNDHVFRHRAPLFMAEVDPERLCVIRSSERILVPQRGARLGNFGVCDVSPRETWVIAAEWMQPVGCEKHGSDNSIYAARIRWSRPNRLASSG